MAQYQILYWQEIPSQLKIHEGSGRPKSVPLPDEFQHKIDEVAMKQGLAGTDAYLEKFNWSGKMDIDDTSEEALAHLIEKLSHEHLS